MRIWDRIRNGARILKSVILGRDFYETTEDVEENRRLKRPDMGIGADCVIERAIIDKNARIGSGVQIIDRNRERNVEADNYFIKDGIVIVPKNATIPQGTVIG